MRSLVDVYPTAHYFGGFLINVANSIQFKRHKGDSSLFVVRALNSKETPPSLHRIQGVYTSPLKLLCVIFLYSSFCGLATVCEEKRIRLGQLLYMIKINPRQII